MSVINTNVSALYAQNALKVNSRSMSTTMEQLSSGNRINSAKDDAAGLAIGQTMTSQIRGLNQAIRNVNDAVSMLQTADGAMVEQSNMLQRMRELAVQSASGTYSSDQRGYLNTEFDKLSTQIGKIATETVWNGKQILAASTVAGTSGDVSSARATSASTAAVTTVGSEAAEVAAVAAANVYDTFTFQTGQSASQTITVKISAMDEAGLKIGNLDITTRSGASTSIAILDNALGTVNAQRATVGAVTNQLSYAADNMSNISQNVSASRSQIMDTDYAEATSKLAKTQIIQQAATAMLAQANQQPQSVLALLK